MGASANNWRKGPGEDGAATGDAVILLADLFEEAAAEMKRRALVRFADCAGLPGVDLFDEVAAVIERAAVAPAEWLAAAAGAGLVPARQPPADQAEDPSLARWLLRHLERRDFRVRPSCPQDLPALLELEEQCWPAPLRTAEHTLRARVAAHPQDHLVMLADDAVVGVIYSQRIHDVAALDRTTAAEVDALHDPAAAIVQLLAVNVLPAVQNRMLGDQLLEFMLVWRSVQPDVGAVVAVTLCRNFEAGRHGSLADYIRLRNEHGVPADPILRFHDLHGATIERLVPGYRPADVRNEGCGVLVTYDIRRRDRRPVAVESEAAGFLAGLSRPRLAAEVEAAVRACLGGEAGAAFSASRPLMEMGLDSAGILELRERLTQRFGLALGPAFFFQHNTADRIVTALWERAGAEPAPAARPTRAVPEATRGEDTAAGVRAEDIAVVGMACRLPGGIRSADDLWACLRDGVSMIDRLPAGRWRWPEGIEPEGRHKGIDRGGFLDDVAAFDAPFFRVSPAEAETMDPQQRLLLELCWEAIENASHAAARLAGSRTGVFVGASGSDYTRLLDQSGQPAEAHYGTGSSMAVLANRISYFFDFRGPSLLVDTACSSSLVAVHEAVRSLRGGECDMALVGGVNLILHPANSIAYYKAGMLSKDGQCKTFDSRADGYVRSEGAVVVVLKPLSRALAEGDRVHAVIRGTACNHGGQASGLTVPNPEQQGRLLLDAWRAAGLDPRHMGYIEAHGTGTPLGDPIEVQGIRHAFAAAFGGEGPPQEWRCGLGSVKTNLGHLEAAAGLAGFLKVVLCLRHGVLPPSLHLRQPNPHVDLSGSGLHLVDRMQPWQPPAPDAPRVAGVSSFGSGGTNGHVVLAEHRRQESPAEAGIAADAEAGPVVFVLSARTPQQLRDYAESFVRWMDGAGAEAPLASLAHRLQVGRQAMEERLALVVAGRAELVERLRAFSAGAVGKCRGETPSTALAEAMRGDAGRAFVRALAAQGDLDSIASLWMAGGDVDWSVLYEAGDGAPPPLRVDPPTYPFARHRYWLPGREPPAAPAEVRPVLLAPRWRPCDTPAAAAGEAVLVVGADDHARRSLAGLLPSARCVEGGADPAASVRACERLDHVLWLAPPAVGDDVLARQGEGLLALFRLVKVLLDHGYGERDLMLTVATRGTQAVFRDDAPAPADAGVHGFVGALAKELPRWRVRALDLEEGAAWPVADILDAPAGEGGEVLARRDGRWLRRVLVPVSGPASTPEAYRQGGVYVVLGGAGGIGAAWTRHVAQRYGAQVVWIGRRPLDDAIRQQIDAIAQVGPAPLYLSADATDRAALGAAYAEIRRRWPAVHGVIHAAVGAFDRSVAQTDESHFRHVLSVKVEAAVHLAEVFAEEPLDFLLYFSSVVALEKTGGLAGYAAGGAFEDAFALHLDARRPYPVKVVNWGHWAIGTGATISDAAKARLQRSGIVPIEPEEAMAGLQRLLSSPLRQAAVLKASRPEALPLVDPSERLHVDPAPADGAAVTLPALDGFVRRVDDLRPLSLFSNAALEAAVAPVLAAILRSLPAAATAGAPAFYQRWLAGSRVLLDELTDAEAAADPDTAWRRWEEAKGGPLASPDLAAAVRLAETCLRALPDVLSGGRRATDVLFPDASMRMVEGVYRNNAVADYFNDMLADVLVAAVAERLRREPAARLRIIEVGAGTGGTTAAVLRRLAPFAAHIEEYAYTDVSRAFLFHAEEHFVPDHPFVRCRLFDLERPLAGQDVAAGAYDLLVATNVLHATRDIRRTLGACKGVLRPGGIVLLNEVSTRSLFAHVTFGLLEGWWLSEDQPLRMEDAPGLYPAAWRTVLGQEGFTGVALPVPEAHVLGQQVVVACSDGVVWRPSSEPPEVAEPAARSRRSVAAPPAAAPVKGASAPKEALEAHLKALVARVLRMDPADVDSDEPLGAYGIDSILTVQITNALREDFDGVDATLLFQHTTVGALSEHFLATDSDGVLRLVGASAPEPAAAPVPPPPAMVAPVAAPALRRAPVEQERAAQEGVAVVGMACRFPQADDAEAFWQVLETGRDCVGEIPADRWPLDGFYHADPDEAVEQGRSYSKWGAFLDGVTGFDPLFFNISPKEAVAIDPQERLFLQTAWHALEDAGYTREHLARHFDRQVGVFVGITRTGFDLFGPDLWRAGSRLYPHTSFSSVANRLSFFLNARGPSVPVDTMCSSSLTAIHQACQSLRSDECAVAIAGGVNVYLHPSGYVGLSGMRMLSPTGRCRSFGKGGDGFVPGEGVAALVLKPLERARADGDRIHAVIRATHVNHGGRTNGYTVPNPQAQADLVRDTLLKAGVDARAVSYIEAHGTGTDLGDPIELAGLTQAFRHFTDDTGFCAIGSAKSNIGHLEAAAGIAGVVKVILQMRHGRLAPSLHAAEINPNIDFSKTPFVLQREAAEWRRPVLPHGGGEREFPRLAGVSSFGAGGANAHVLLEEHVAAPAEPVPAAGPCLIVLSARNEACLRAAAGRLHDFVARRLAAGCAPALVDVAHTLQVGREQMDQRLAFVALSVEDLRDRLGAWLGGSRDGVFTGHLRDHKREVDAFLRQDGAPETLAAWLRDGSHDRLLALWAKGLTIDWERLHQSAGLPRGRCIGLPGYPFETTRYWLPTVPPAPPVPPAEAVPAATPEPAPPSAAAASAPVVAAAKPRAIALRDPASVPTTFTAPAAKPRHRLRTPAAGPTRLAVKVRDHGDGIVEVDACGGSPGDSLAALARPGAGAPAAKVVVLTGVGDAAAAAAALPAVAGCPLPVVGVVPPDSPLADACDIAAADAEAALAAARDMARAPLASLVALKEHLRRPAAVPPAEGSRLDAGFTAPAVEAPRPAPQRVPLASQVVTLETWPNGVALLSLVERAGKNTFTPAFVDGVLEAFAHLRGNPACKVVVLTGYDSYFACGGTRDGLLAIQSGKARFTDEQSYAQPLLCDIPVIAAMQGHGIGAGWTMGLFCDLAIYSAESVYQSPYMLYGFTPGAGSTMIFPHRLGPALAREILFTAREFTGRELAERGIAMPVLPRRRVLPHALALADHLATAPRDALVAAKTARCRALREHLPAAFAGELALHDHTFVGNSDVVSNIDRYFKGSSDAPAAQAVPASAADLDVLRDRLRRSLAEELGTSVEEVDDHTAFLDLGMDSISAVTWIRKVNKEFGVSLGATRIYSHPDLARFAALVAEETGGAVPAAPPEPDPAPQPGPTPVPASGGGSELLDWLRDTLAAELGMTPDMLDDDGKFVDLGLDSVTAVTWIRGINRRLGLTIAAPTVYSHPTLTDFHRHLLDLGAVQAPAAAPARGHAEPPPPAVPAVAAEAVPAPAAPAPAAAVPRAAAGPEIAIVGMAGRFPQAPDLATFWRNLVEGRDCVSEIPPRRWSIDAYHDPDRSAPGKTVCRSMGVLEDLDLFDPLFFGISPSEAEVMDPQQRLFLQAAWHCIEDAGYDPTGLAGSACGVFVGCAVSDYGLLTAGHPNTAQALLGESVAILPARIAYVLDLQGPCLAVDTACSASLVAIANACDSLSLGNCDAALAGGVYVTTGPEIHVKMSKAGMLSPSGRCFTFDERADGFVPGEGVGVLMLKRLDDARRDGDDVYAVIRGWGVNQDGKTNGITAPNGDSQTRLLAGVYDRFGIDPATIGMVEAHGTGTKLGDPIEVEALKTAFGRFTQRRHYCALGSVKSNIGHLATAAGVSGVVKAALALANRRIPPTINHRTLNEHIDLADSAFFINTRCRDWAVDAGQPRRAAVSSFGFSGTNAHVVIEEAPQRPVAVSSREPVVVPLSARSPAQVAELARALLDHLDAAPAVDLADLAYTLQVGRAAMPHRLAVVARTTAELAEALRAHLAGAPSGETWWSGVAPRKPLAASGPLPAEPASVARRWVAGEAVDWRDLHRAGARRRLHGLPTYPFERERYWVTPAPATPTAPSRDDGPWAPAPLPDDVPWQDRLRERLARPVAVVEADAALATAFRRLLGQLAQAGGVSDGAVSWVRADGPPAADAEWVVWLGGSAEAAARWLGGGRSALVHLAADERQAEAAGAVLATAGRRVVVSHRSGEAPEAVAQRLFREWLAHDGGSTVEVHYDGEVRRVRASRPRHEPASRLEKRWVEKPVGAAIGHRRGTALLLVNAESWPVARTLLTGAGFADVVVVSDTDLTEQGVPNMVAFGDPHAARLAAVTLLERHDDVTHVFDLSDLHGTPRDHDGDKAGKVVFLQALLGTGADLSILHVTRGLHPCEGEPASLAGARFAGLVRMLSADYGTVRARCVDIDTAAWRDPARLRTILLSEADAALAETESCWRGDRRLVPVLTVAEEAVTPVDLPVAQDGLYVVSGGTSGVGLQIARHLAAKGCTRLLLMGVTPLPPRAQWAAAAADPAQPEALRERLRPLLELAYMVPHMEVYTGPLTDRAALREMLDRVRRTLGPIRGVVHAAGVYSDLASPAFAGKALCRMRQVWEPKMDGLEALFAEVAGDPPDFFLCLSSMTALVPQLARGAGDYAMANAFMDFFTSYQRRRHGAAWLRTVAWSDWNDAGAILRVDPALAASVTATFDRLGLRTFTSREGCALFDLAAVGAGGGTVVLGYLDRTAFERSAPTLLHARPGATDGGASALSDALARWEARGGTVPVDEVTQVVELDDIKALDPALIQRLHAVMFGPQPESPKPAPPPAATGPAAVIEATVREVLKLRSIDPTEPFQNYGLDSISATVLATRLEKRLGAVVEPQWLIQYPTVETLARHLSLTEATA